jgi:hypothetical protein
MQQHPGILTTLVAAGRDFRGSRADGEEMLD